MSEECCVVPTKSDIDRRIHASFFLPGNLGARTLGLRYTGAGIATMKGGIPTQRLSADQRKALAEILGAKSDARRRAHAGYQNSRNQLEDSLVKETAEKKGVTTVTSKITELRKRITESMGEIDRLVYSLRDAHGRAVADFTRDIDDAQSELRRLGFDADGDGNLSLRWDAHELRRTIREQVEKQIGTESDIDHKFDEAQAKILTVETPEEAAQIVESLL